MSMWILMVRARETAEEGVERRCVENGFGEGGGRLHATRREVGREYD
jgi:hypothetical protein